MSYRKHGEAEEQETLIAWAAWGLGMYPELGLIFHIPNGGSRNAIEAKNLKRQGVKAGVPDLFLPVSKNGYHGLWIEMKFGKNKTTPKQNWWISQLKKQGYFVRVCYGADEAVKVICSYLGIPKSSPLYSSIILPERTERQWANQDLRHSQRRRSGSCARRQSRTESASTSQL